MYFNATAASNTFSFIHVDFTDALFWLAISGILISLIIIGLQIRQTRRMEKIVDTIKARNDKRKHYLLPRIKHNTLLIKEALQTLQNRIDQYERDPSKEPWGGIRTCSTASIIHIIDYGKAAVADLDRLFEIIDDPSILDTYHSQNVLGSILPFQTAINMSPELDRYRTEGRSKANLEAFDLVALKTLIAERITILDSTIAALDAEMPKEKRKPKFWQARASLDQSNH